MGYHQSVRPAHGRLLVNIDVAATTFYKEQDLVDFAGDIVGIREKGQLAKISGRDAGKLSKNLKRVRVVTTHRGKMKRKYSIKAIIPESARQKKFDLHDENGNVTGKSSVEQFFQSRYNIRLKYPNMPLVEVGGKNRVHLPMEVLRVIKGQRMSAKLTPDQTSVMIKKTTQKPHLRVQTIQQQTAENEYDRDPVLSEFHVSVKQRMVRLNGRVLPPPMLQYNTSSRQSTVKPNDGVWRPRNVHLFSPAKLGAWGFLVFENERFLDTRSIRNFVSTLVKEASSMGMRINPNAPITYARGRDPIERSIETALNEVARVTKLQPQMLMVVLPGKGENPYGEVKRLMDCHYDIIKGKTSKFKNNVSNHVTSKAKGAWRCIVEIFC